MDLMQLAEQVIQVARQAGDLVKRAQTPEIFVKEGSANFVTSTDIAAQKLILAGLAPLIEGASFFAEEQESNTLAPGYNWVVDPIDGTTNFMLDFHHSAISIGLVKDNVSVLGVVYNPYLDELFSAVRGKGAWCNGTPIHTGSCKLSEGVFIIGTFPYDRSKADEVFTVAKNLFSECMDIRRLGSAALDLCYVAAGRSVGFYEIQLSPWDYAAGTVILEEAGGKLTTLHGDALPFNTPSGVIAANSQTYDDILAVVSKHL